MAKLPSTYAVDSGKKLSNGLNDIIWMSTEGVVPEKRWFIAGEELPKGESEPTVWGSGSVDSDGHLVVNYYREEVFGPIHQAPQMWFVLADGRNKTPQQMALFGFWDNSYPTGTIVSQNEAIDKLGIEHLSKWAGMISWHVGDPVIQQVMTAPQYRRKRISIMMFGVCDVVNACYGFSPGLVLHGGAVTTEDGEKLRNIYPQSARIDPRRGSVEHGKNNQD
jgi:hypothetical protein